MNIVPGHLYVRQQFAWDCGVACYLMTRSVLGMPEVDHDEASRLLAVTPESGTTTAEYERAMSALVAEHRELKLECGVDGTRERLASLLDRGAVTTICYLSPTSHEGHFGIVQFLSDDAMVLADPDEGPGFRIPFPSFKWRTGFELPARLGWYCSLVPPIPSAAVEVAGAPS